MALIAQPSGNSSNRVEQPAIDAGVYPARLVQILDLGLQPQRPYQGQEKPPAPEISLTYELVDTFCVDENGNELEDKPRWISETFPLYSIDKDKAKSTKRYFALDPKGLDGGDFAAQVEKPINVTIVLNEKGEKVYVNVAHIAAMRERDAAKCPPLKNPPKVFDLDAPDMTIFGSLPQWLQDKIKSNLNFKGSKLEAAIGGKPPVEEKPQEAPEPKGADDSAEEDAPW